MRYTMMRRLGQTTVIALVLGLPLAAAAASVTLAWDPNSESDLAGYRVYYDTDQGPPYAGAQAAEGPSPLDYPLTSLSDVAAPQVTLTGLPS
jgi:hypothetical protein